MDNEQLIEGAGKRAAAVLGNHLADLMGKWSMLKPDGVRFSPKALAELIAEREDISVGQAAKYTPREACEALDRYLNPPRPAAPPSPVIVLRDEEMPPLVFGKPVTKPLTKQQDAVVQALLKAGPAGLGKKDLEAITGDARKVLNRMSENPEWSEAIIMPGKAHGRYRIAYR